MAPQMLNELTCLFHLAPIYACYVKNSRARVPPQTQTLAQKNSRGVRNADWRSWRENGFASVLLPPTTVVEHNTAFPSLNFPLSVLLSLKQ